MAAGDGLPELVTPYNASEFQEVVRAAMAHFNALKGQAEVVSADLRRLLPKATNTKGRLPLGVDLRIAAIQIARQWSQVAAGCNSAGAAASKSLTLFHGNFVTPTGGHTGRTFDVGK